MFDLGNRKLTWRHASRAECTQYHNNRSANLLAFNPPQLDLGSQLDTLKQTAGSSIPCPSTRLLPIHTTRRPISIGAPAPTCSSTVPTATDAAAVARAVLKPA